MRINFVDHISLIVKNLDTTEKFYSKFLDHPIIQNENMVVYKIGETRLFFKTNPLNTFEEKYNKDNVGMNHIGLGIKTMDELRDFERLLTEKGIQHSEIKTGRFGNEYIWFDDPDGIRLEIYRN